MTHKLVKGLRDPVELRLREPGVERERERVLEGMLGAREEALVAIGGEKRQSVRADLRLDPFGPKGCEHLVALRHLDHVRLPAVHVAFVGVDSDDSSAAARTFLKELPVPYPSYSDPHHDIAETIKASVGFPATAFYDSRGKLVYVRQGQYPSESALVFLADDTGVCLQRRDGGSRTAVLGTARPPYKQWTWKNLGRAIGGPGLIQLPSGRVVPLSFFFDRALSVRKLVANVVAEEDPASPYSDQEISDILRSQGVVLARRTVMKYREEMNILSSRQRARVTH